MNSKEVEALTNLATVFAVMAAIFFYAAYAAVLFIPAAMPAFGLALVIARPTGWTPAPGAAMIVWYVFGLMVGKTAAKREGFGPLAGPLLVSVSGLVWPIVWKDGRGRS